MITLLTAIGRWLMRNALALAAIVLVLYIGNLLLQEWREFRSARAAIPELEQQLASLRQQASGLVLDHEQRLQQLRRAPAQAVEARRIAIDAQLRELRAEPVACASTVLCLATGHGAGIVADQRREITIRLLELEQQALGLVAHEQLLERLRQAHAAAYAELRAESAPDARPLCPVDPDSWRARLQARLTGSERHLLLCRRNREAYDAYLAQKALHDSLARPMAASAVVQEALRPVEAEFQQRMATASGSWLGKMLQDISALLPVALGILAAALLLPVAIKALLYYVIAPLASRRPPVHLLPEPATVGQPVAAAFRSAVSREIEVDATHELLVHSDYLQSSATASPKDTKWLLDVRYPLASLASGMTVLTRIRPRGTESVVVSSGSDPFSEVGILTLAPGEAMVLQPRCLVGVLQERGRPVRITSHWRLGSLSAWLTLQLRYLVFHGPGSLVVRGCRGVRVETPGAGRLINQAATMGFSAHIEYSVIRSETFAAYLLGRQALFNDRFTGSSGVYVYEEMPDFGRKSGITGRGLEGLLDSVLKIFGI